MWLPADKASAILKLGFFIGESTTLQKNTKM
jgi:hypothetical protein